MLDSTFDISLNGEELDLLLHFAEIGREKVYHRDAWGDRSVVREVDPVILRLRRLMLASFQGSSGV